MRNIGKTLSSSKYSFYNEEIRKHSCQCVFGICCFLRIYLLRRFVVSRTGVTFRVFLACSKLSDCGEDAKVKDALSQFSGPDYLRPGITGGAWNRLAFFTRCNQKDGCSAGFAIFNFFSQEDMTIALSGWVWDG